MGLIFADRVNFVTDDKHPLGEYKAYFATNSDLAKAFKSVAAAPGLKSSGGIIPMGRSQINDRITTLGGDPDSADKDAKLNGKVKDAVAELRKGRDAIDRTLALKAAQNARPMTALTA